MLFLLWWPAVLAGLSVVCSAPSVEGRRVFEAAVARCFFRTGDSERDSRLTPFYVPLADKQMYEEGIRDYLAQIGSSSDQVSVACVETKETDVECELCLYNEVSEDRRHVRQGQVLDTMLTECIEGRFKQGSTMANSQYHPICYPPPQQRLARDAREPEERSISPHQPAGEGASKVAGPDSCTTGGKGPGL